MLALHAVTEGGLCWPKRRNATKSPPPPRRETCGSVRPPLPSVCSLGVGVMNLDSGESAGRAWAHVQSA
eukprot:2557857-Rhodomonas_salina.2